MKTLLIGLIGLLSIFGVSNVFVPSTSYETTYTNSQANQTTESLGEIIFYEKGNKTLVYAVGEDDFFIFQSKESLNLDKGMKLKQVTTEGISLEYQTTKEITNKFLGDKIYGFAKISGKNLKKGLLSQDISGNIIFNSQNSDEIFARACECRDSGSSDEDCKSGGEGASSCSHGTGVGVDVVVAGSGGSSSCSIKCKGDLYACCKKPINFDDDGQLVEVP